MTKITIGKNLSQKSNQRLTQMIVSSLIQNNFDPLIVSDKLNIASRAVRAIVRGMTYGTVGFAKGVYKGQYTSDQIGNEFRGVTGRAKRTMQEAYTAVGGSIEEPNAELLDAYLEESQTLSSGAKRKVYSPRKTNPLTKEEKSIQNADYHQRRKAVIAENERLANLYRAKQNTPLNNEQREAIEDTKIEVNIPDLEDTNDGDISDFIGSLLENILGPESEEPKTKDIVISIDGVKIVLELTEGSTIQLSA